MDLALLPLLRCPISGGPLELKMITPGRSAGQGTLTEEWEALGDDEHTFTFVYTDAELEALHRDVWLRMSEVERAGVRSALNVGIGFGKETRVLAALFPNAMTVGVDLNLALVQAGRLLSGIPRTHAVVASLFRLPFEPGAFDHVHSQGVIHHTYSTRAAFDSIARFVRPGGTLFVWVYAAEDPYIAKGPTGFLVWLYCATTHRIFRPILSRSPAVVRNAVMYVIASVLHPMLKRRASRPAQWRFANTLHGLYDAFTPRYAHQHGFNEVVESFEDAGFEPRLQSPAKYRRLMGKRLLGVGVIGRREA